MHYTAMYALVEFIYQILSPVVYSKNTILFTEHVRFSLFLIFNFIALQFPANI